MKKIALLLCLCLTGCAVSTRDREKVAPVESEYPVLAEPVRPVLEKVTPEDLAPLSEIAREKLKKNNDALMLYSTKLKRAFDAYNQFAKWKNSRGASAFGVEVDDGKKEATP